jgi:CubicO group peptidase (beta-lactamase class C family)
VIRRHRLSCGAGHYSGVAFGIAARVAEVVMGKPFEQVMREVQPRPLGMSNTRFGSPERLPTPGPPSPKKARSSWAAAVSCPRSTM